MAVFLAGELFLALNGRRFVAGKADAMRVMLATAAGGVAEGNLADWFDVNLGCV